jgi:hypothetical protein
MPRARTLALTALALTPALALAARPADVTGDYESNWGPVHLVQHGREISGTYDCCGGGTITGELSGGTTPAVHFRWQQPTGEGLGVWYLDRQHPDRLDGSWGTESVEDGGPWLLTRAARPAVAHGSMSREGMLRPRAR